MATKQESNSEVRDEMVVALIQMTTGAMLVFVRYYATHPDELNIIKRRIAAFMWRRCERISMYWWDKTLSCAEYYNRLRP